MDQWMQLAALLGGLGARTYSAGKSGSGPLAGLLGPSVEAQALTAAGPSGIPGGADGAWDTRTTPTATQAALTGNMVSDASGTYGSGPASNNNNAGFPGVAGMGGGTASMFGAPPGQLSTTLSAGAGPTSSIADGALGGNLDGAQAGLGATLQGAFANGKAATFLGALADASKSKAPEAQQAGGGGGLGGTKQLNTYPSLAGNGQAYSAGSLMAPTEVGSSLSPEQLRIMMMMRSRGIYG